MMKANSPTDSLAPLIRPPADNKAVGSRLERQLSDYGYVNVAGIDEAGRGPLAGPVVAACVILDGTNIPAGINDSKKLGPDARKRLYDEILTCSQVAVASISAGMIDKINIRKATLSCMANASSAMATPVGWHLIDGRDIPEKLKQCSSAVIRGDGYSQSIAAASIVAKVVRDQIMLEAGKAWPQYGFEKHKGYGTKLHLEAIARHGPCPIHRMSFAPIAVKA